MTAVHGQQYIGQRETQEDSFDIIRQSEQDPSSDLLMLLSDGMGGHAGGEVASNLSIQTFRKHFIELARSARPLERLQESLMAANDAIRIAIQRDADLRGMGCTFIGAIKIGGMLHWTSVGDSALYLYRRGTLNRLNADHSVLGELMGLVEKGKLTRSEALAHPRRNALRSAVTGAPISLVDTRSIALERDDLVILATDGLDTLPTSEVADILARSPRNPREAASALLQAVERRAVAAQDNATVVIYRHADGPASAMVADSKWALGPDGRRYGFAALAVAAVVLIGIGLGYLVWQPTAAPAPAVAVPAADPSPSADNPVTDPAAPRRNVGIPDTSKPVEPSGDAPSVDAPSIAVPDAKPSDQAPADSTETPQTDFPTDEAVRKALEADEAEAAAPSAPPARPDVQPPSETKD